MSQMASMAKPLLAKSRPNAQGDGRDFCGGMEWLISWFPCSPVTAPTLGGPP